MEAKIFNKNWIKPMISYSILTWTIFCLIGTWYIIFKYGVIPMGLVAIVMTFLIAAIIWVIPLAILALLITPSSE